MNSLTTVLAFIVTIGILITIHEYGHYRVAVACGVKVLRFSIGFGKPLLRWQRGETEFVVAALPLGGYVRMLGERGSEEPIPAAERHRALDNRPLWQRSAVVLAGPLANLLLAVVLYTGINWAGVEEVQPLLGAPAAGSLAEAAGLQAGQRVLAVSPLGEPDGQGGEPDGNRTEIRSMTDLRWKLMQAALDGRAVQLEVQEPGSAHRQRLKLDLASLKAEVDTGLLARIGLPDVYIEPVLGPLKEGSPAQQAGLAAGDRVLAVDGKPVQDFVAVSRLIRASIGQDGKPRAVVLRIQRPSGEFDARVQPRLSGGKQPVALIDAPPAGGPQMTTVRYGVLDGITAAAGQTWNMSAVTLRMLWRIATRQASLDGISGPLTIADYAGRSARLGLSYYIGFLAVVSVSLGVLNLLPLPILDGGHLMYYLFEGVTGRPIPEEWLDRLQRGGLVIMLLVMSLAFYNDVVRYLGQT